MADTKQPRRPVPHFPRRVAAIFYDALVMAAVAMLATAPLLLLTGGEAIRAGAWWFRVYLLSVCCLFFCWFWTHGGQTLGMRAWRLRLESAGGEAVGWKQALLRFAAACLSLGALGLGLAWALVDRDRLALHDRMSGTRPVVLGKHELNG